MEEKRRRRAGKLKFLVLRGIGSRLTYHKDKIAFDGDKRAHEYLDTRASSQLQSIYYYSLAAAAAATPVSAPCFMRSYIRDAKKKKEEEDSRTLLARSSRYTEYDRRDPVERFSPPTTERADSAVKLELCKS